MSGRFLRKLRIEKHERIGVVIAFVYFFCLLCGYYIMRPVREEMGVQAGTKNLPWLFTAVFVVMLTITPIFGWLAARLPRQKLLPAIYVFFIANLIAFYVLWHGGAPAAWTAPAFFIWVSVFNLFVVSVFWSFMADLFTLEQSERLYGPIAAGGSLGAIAGPSITSSIVEPLGVPSLLIVSSFFLLLCIACIMYLAHWARSQDSSAKCEEALGGSAWEGLLLVLQSPYLLLICGYILLHSLVGTALYFEQVRIVGATLETPEARTALFAKIDLAVNVLTTIIQIVALSALVKRIGVGWSLALLPLLGAAGIAIFLFSPTLSVLVGLIILRRAGEYAITRPAREMLFTVLPRTVKYKAKNFLDTTVFRGADAGTGWLVGALTGIGIGMAFITAASIPLAALGAFVGWRLGQSREIIQVETTTDDASTLSSPPPLAQTSNGSGGAQPPR